MAWDGKEVAQYKVDPNQYEYNGRIRRFLQPSSVQVALYDDRLEVTSPGMLLGGVSIEKIKEGYSKIRNRGIASAFAYMRIIEVGVAEFQIKLF